MKNLIEIAMKKRYIYLILLCCSLAVLSLLACKKNEGYNAPPSEDKTKPDVVTNVRVEDYNGGSYLIYDLPNSPNILYVLAKYQIRNGVPRETKSSYYSDTIKVEGFAKDQEYDVTLYTVSRSDIMSDPLVVKVHPKTPVYTEVSKSLSIEPDFGGVHIKASNPLKKEIGILVTAFNPSTQSMDVYEQHYTKNENVDFSVRGFNTDPRDFGVFVTDRFGNISDTLKSRLSPLFEQMLDKSRFSAFILPSDTEIYPAWTVNNLWNGTAGGNGWHTNPGQLPPFTATFNMEETYKLSRFILFNRPEQYAFSHGNPKLFSLWGSNATSPRDIKLPVAAVEGDVVGDWTNLGNFRFPDPPSGLSPGATNAADNAFIKAGVEFNVPLAAPAVKFMRVAVNESWSGGDFAHIMELTFYGQNN
jgi:hypothetical protein